MIFAVWSVIVGGLLVVMALSGTLLKRLPLTTSMLYLAIGFSLGPLGWGILRIDPIEHSAALERLTEVAVIVSLFTAGLKMRVPFGDVRWQPAVLLATLTMLTTIAIMVLFGVGLLHFPLAGAVLVAAILAPTDPVLASDVQVEHATDRDRLRFGLTGEAGLNDGTAFPMVMLGLGLLGLHELGPSGMRWLGVDVIWATIAGLGIGWILAYAVARITVHLRQEHAHGVGLEDFLALGLIALSYGLALLVHAYGFLAVFAAGVALRHFEMRATGEQRAPQEVMEVAVEELATHPEAAPAYMAHAVLGFSEQMERILELTLMLLVGAMLATVGFSWQGVIFVLALLFVIRPLAVLATFHGPGALRAHRPYVAWFGIRGIGSLYYLMYALQHGLQGPLARSMVNVVLTAVAASAVIHGITVTPFMQHYTRGAGRRRHAGGSTPASS